MLRKKTLQCCLSADSKSCVFDVYSVHDTHWLHLWLRVMSFFCSHTRHLLCSPLRVCVFIVCLFFHQVVFVIFNFPLFFSLLNSLITLFLYTCFQVMSFIAVSTQSTHIPLLAFSPGKYHKWHPIQILLVN